MGNSSSDGRDWLSFLEQELFRKESSGLLRRRGGVLAGSEGSVADFGSNDYLGLRLKVGLMETLANSSCLGSGASPVLSGHTAEHQALEERIARLCGAESALVFGSGYACNVGVISCLAQTGDLIVSDQLNHASLIDGCRLSKACKYIFRHNDLEDVRGFLRSQRHKYRRVLLVTESVFSMDGDRASLRRLADLADEYECGLVVDEAHAFGVYGRKGSGLLEELGLGDRVLVKLGTLSKSAGSMGGYVCGERTLVNFLVNHCRSYIFSTAPPPGLMTATRCTIEHLEQMEGQRVTLRDTARRVRKDLTELGWYTSVHAFRNSSSPDGGSQADMREEDPADSPIIPIIVGSEERALRISDYLLKQSLYVPAIRPPTVPPGTARLRVSLSTNHTDQQVSKLIQALAVARGL